MSKISQIHDALIAMLAGLLPDYARLPNPYFFQENNELYLKKGFGVSIGPGFRTNRELNCHLSWQRTFNVSLTRLVSTTDHNITQHEDIVKSMLDDHALVIESLEKNVQLNGPNGNNGLCIRCEAVSDAGIQYLEGRGGRYFLLEIDVMTEYMRYL